MIGAVQFGIGIRQQGYNLFVSGPTGIGKHWTMQHLLRRERPTNPRLPIGATSTTLRSRAAVGFAVDPRSGGHFASGLSPWCKNSARPSPPYLRAKNIGHVKRPLKSKPRPNRQALRGAFESGQAKGIGVARTPAGFVFAPLREGEGMSPTSSRAPGRRAQAVRGRIDISTGVVAGGDPPGPATG